MSLFKTSEGSYYRNDDHLVLYLVGGPFHGEKRERTCTKIGSVVVIQQQMRLEDYDLTPAGAEIPTEPEPLPPMETYFAEYITNGDHKYWYLRHESVTGEDSVPLLIECLSTAQIKSA
jgi:hypothetical protein